MLCELWSEKFEWFGPSPIEPFNLAPYGALSSKGAAEVTCVAFSIKFAKTNQKFAENSEFCEKNSLLFKIIHFTPYSRPLSERPMRREAQLTVGAVAELRDRVVHRREPKLKGSIGEGPNHSNFSDRSSVRILSKFRNFRWKIQKFRKFSTFSKISAKFFLFLFQIPTKYHQTLSKNQRKEFKNDEFLQILLKMRKSLTKIF